MIYSSGIFVDIFSHELVIVNVNAMVNLIAGTLFLFLLDKRAAK